MNGGLGSAQRRGTRGSLDTRDALASLRPRAPRSLGVKSISKCIQTIVLLAEQEFLGALINSPAA